MHWGIIGCCAQKTIVYVGMPPSWASWISFLTICKQYVKKNLTKLDLSLTDFLIYFDDQRTCRLQELKNLFLLSWTHTIIYYFPNKITGFIMISSQICIIYLGHFIPLLASYLPLLSPKAFMDFSILYSTYEKIYFYLWFWITLLIMIPSSFSSEKKNI